MKLRTPVALAGAAALAITTGLVTTADPSSAAATKSYAYGLSINGEGKQPYVESTDGSTQSSGEAAVADNPVVSGTIAELKAGDDVASVRVANLTIGSGAQQIPADVVTQLNNLKPLCDGLGEAPGEQVLNPIRDGLPTGLELPTEEDVVEFCNGLVDADLPALASVDTVDISCDGDSGAVTIAGLRVLGAELPFAGDDIAPGTTLFDGEAAPLGDAVQVTLNRQTQRPDGAFSVDGVVVSLGGGQGEIVLGHTTCGEPLPAEPEVKGEERNEPRPAPAQAPAPVQRDLPVTG